MWDSVWLFTTVHLQLLLLSNFPKTWIKLTNNEMNSYKSLLFLAKVTKGVLFVQNCYFFTKKVTNNYFFVPKSYTSHRYPEKVLPILRKIYESLLCSYKKVTRRYFPPKHIMIHNFFVFSSVSPMLVLLKIQRLMYVWKFCLKSLDCLFAITITVNRIKPQRSVKVTSVVCWSTKLTV